MSKGPERHDDANGTNTPNKNGKNELEASLKQNLNLEVQDAMQK